MSPLIERSCLFFFFNDTATTEIYTLSLHDALPIYRSLTQGRMKNFLCLPRVAEHRSEEHTSELQSRVDISYAVFCLKKKQNNTGTCCNTIHIFVPLHTIKPTPL